MKNIKHFLTLTLVLMMICFSAVSAAASTIPAVEPEPEASMADRLSEIIDITPDTPYGEDQSDDGAFEDISADTLDDIAEIEQEDQEESQPYKKSSNTPYFVGAIIAVIVFVGVALYCKFKGGA